MVAAVWTQLHGHITLHRGDARVSRVVRGEELQDLFRAVKGAFHDLVSSSCAFGRMAPEGGDLHQETTRPASKNRDAVEYLFIIWDSTQPRHSRRPGKA